MDVEIDDCRALEAFRLQHADGDRHVVEGTEPFTVIRKRVMQSTADVRGDASFRVARTQRSLDRSADHRAKAVDHFLRPRELELRGILIRHRAVPHLREVLRRVHQREIVPARRCRVDDVRRSYQSALQETCVNESILFGWKNVQPDIDVISG